MAAKTCISQAVVWNWVIEALASFEQADTSTLIGLMKTAPVISGDLGKDAREVVALRILESLFLHGDSAQNAEISFDASERCENVLQQILHKTPKVMTNLEKEKLDVRSFLMHKRSSLPECMLKKLREAILENSHPLLASLKERGNFVITNASENISLTDEDNFDVQATVDKDDLAFLNPRKDKNRYQDFTDHAAKYEAFLNSKCTHDQDMLGGIGWSEMDLCIKCNEGDQLLVCSSDSCLIRVHERCLRSAVRLDENGQFFCPFCAYSRAISECLEAGRKASLARKDLQAFFSFKKQSELKKTGKQTTDFPEPSTPKQKSKKKGIHRSNEFSCSRNLRKRKAQS